MALDALLDLLKSGVSDVSDVQASNHGASGGYGSDTAGVSGVSVATGVGDADTADTAREKRTYQPEALQTGACTADTADTSQTIKAEAVEPCEAFEERAAIMEFDAGLPRAEAERLAALDAGCITCTNYARPGLSGGYCGGRDDLPRAYGENHPLRRLPDDQCATCKEWRPI